jgi:hypothetical protein
MQKSIHIFISYAREDERLRKKLETHLGLLQQEGMITTWYDRNISAGAEWISEINDHLNTSQIILLLVSAPFLASNYCYSIEMARALERHERGEARVLPIILRPVHWQSAPFSKLQALPTDAHPVTGRRWRNIDEALADVTQGIRKVVEELLSSKDKRQPGFLLEVSSGHREELLSSHVVLIDASLDPNDSAYKQTVEDGRKTIRYKG